MQDQEPKRTQSFLVKNDEADAARRDAWEKRRYRAVKTVTFLLLATWATLLIKGRGELSQYGVVYPAPDFIGYPVYTMAWTTLGYATTGLMFLAILMCRSWSPWRRLALCAGLQASMMVWRYVTFDMIWIAPPLALVEIFTLQAFSLLLFSPALLVFDRLPPLGRNELLHSIPGRMLPPMVFAWLLGLALIPWCR